jgi:hypothetical protein
MATIVAQVYFLCDWRITRCQTQASNIATKTKGKVKLKFILGLTHFSDEAYG